MTVTRYYTNSKDSETFTGPDGPFVLYADYAKLEGELAATKDEKLEAALIKVHGIVAEYWGPCPGSIETLCTIRDAIGGAAKDWRPSVPPHLRGPVIQAFADSDGVPPGEVV